ncbi:MAG: CDP-alcohol phosphatidyltransferase family protein [Gammaproteobacteria bacterium]
MQLVCYDKFESEKLNLSNIPNLISIIRMILVIPVVILMLEGDFEWALGLFIIAGLSDALDGYLAKRFNWVSRMGEILDPLADKLLMISCYLVLGWLAHLPLFLVLVVIIRDLIIVLGAIAYHYNVQKITITPTFISKINTTAQILLICIVLFSLVVVELPAEGLNAMFIVVFITTMASGIDYIIIWSKRSFKNHQS